MIIKSKKGHVKVELDDKQMSVIMFVLAVVIVHWDELKDPEVTATQDDLIRAVLHLVKSYLKANGVSEKELSEILDKLSNGEAAVL